MYGHRQQCGALSAALRDSIREYYIKVDNNEALGGLPADNGWVLRGVQNDTLGLHEFLAMNISRGAGWWAPRTQFTEVITLPVISAPEQHSCHKLCHLEMALTCFGTCYTFESHLLFVA